MMRTPDGHSRLELSRFLTPPTVADHRNAPVNALGYLRVMFAVDDVDETLARLRKHGAELVSSEVVQYEDAIGSATSAGLKDFSSDSPRNSAELRKRCRALLSRQRHKTRDFFGNTRPPGLRFRSRSAVKSKYRPAMAGFLLCAR